MSDLLKIVSSQYKHLPGRSLDQIEQRTIRSASVMRNEPFSFQALYKAPETFLPIAVSIAVETSIPATAYRVDYVPIMNTMNLHKDKTGYESELPGLYPDILMPRPSNPEIYFKNTIGDYGYFEKDCVNLLNATDTDYQSVWITLNQANETLTAGEYSVTVKMISLADNSIMAEETITVEIIDAVLPEQKAYYTNWFHIDCVCDYFDVEPYSDEFYEIFDKYVTNMTLHRQNVLLLPAFTPPLDTPIGQERKNVQLVDIDKVNGEWRFGFKKMQRYVQHALKCGIKTFEHCHLFSQWGAVAAPNIYTTDGEHIFGFETDASSDEYIGFIRAYLTAFMKFAKQEGIDKSLLFHISDEPAESHFDSYKKAKDNVADILKGQIVADAMCSMKFYDAGLVDHPIAFMRHADDFDGKCPTLWLYYTGYPLPYCTNRMIPNTAARTRVLGVQLYRYKAKGFLDWAYNFYYDRLSAGIYDPKSAPGGYKMYPGIAYLAYPMITKSGGEVVPSLREKLMAEAFDDLRALQLLEERVGRDEVMSICEKHLGEINSQTDPDKDSLFVLRQAINKRIKETN